MDLAKLKVVELRALLSERGLDAKGNKPVLVERLRKAIEEEEEEEQMQEHGQDGSTLETENSDTAFKETQERVAEAARSSQSPRTPSRASRSSSMVTPTKVSTRNASRAMTPNSPKQATPSKLQYIEKTEVLTISESTSEESELQQQEKISKLSSEKYKEEQEDNALHVVQNVGYPLPSEKFQEEEAKRTNILENRYEANVPQVPATEPSEKSSIIAHVDQFSIRRAEYEAKEFSIDEEDSKVQQSAEKTKDIAKVEEKAETKEDIDEVQDDTFEKDIERKVESVEKESIKYIEDTRKIKGNIDIPTIEQSMHVIPDQLDKTCDIELKNEEKITDENYTAPDEEMDSVNAEDANGKANNDALQDEQVAEMADVKQEDVKFDSEQSNQKECNDKKRKRSPSPAEVYQKSPTPQKTEDEPDFDETAVILSWYDSDLNLVIDKEGFLSATPMHDGDFCYIWAGARASYGFVNGKMYYEIKITEQHSTAMKDEKHSHVLRTGWSVSSTSMQLGEEKLSYAYTSAGKKGVDRKFVEYGTQFNKGDVVGCYLDMTPEDTVELFYTVNGKDLGPAFSIPKEELGERPLFPHILSKNCTFVCNFGQEEAWCEQIPEYVFVGDVDLKDRVAGPRRPDARSDCEVIMMCGLPAGGKTFWARKHAAEHPDKFYNILGVHNLVEKTGDVAVSDEEQNAHRREVINKCNRALDQLIDTACGRRRNYILDQKSNVYSSVQRRKMRNFGGYQRKAIVVIPTNEEYSQRLAARGAEGDTSESSLMELKANFAVPSVGESFDVVEWGGVDETEGKKLIEKYNKEGKEAGFGQHAAKRPRFDKTEGNRETRDSRNNRDTRDSRDYRRNNYQDRGRNVPWRGANMGGWRGERPQRGGYMRHTGYGPHPAPWRSRGRGGPAIRGSDRRIGSVDRRNDRNRPVPRQGGWGQMSSNYQGSQQSGWGQQDNWSSGQSQNWNQQSWGQQQSWGGGWKGYGQGTGYQTGYSQQQGYGNGNWNSWNQQYYNNQYWGQQQQSGQITAAGSQAEATSETVATTSTDMEAGYSYSQG